MTFRLIHADCVEAMAAMDEASVDAIVTDPPYGLEFMGKEWDGADGFRRSLNRADVDRDNPFGRASRTSPEYRAGSLFQAWCETWAVQALRVLKPGGHLLAFGGTRTFHRLTCALEDAGFEIRDCLSWLYGSGFPKSKNLDGDWQGWGTALKPAFEPIVLARKPLTGTVASNVMEYGTGALNVDGCRIEGEPWSYPSGPGGSEPHHMERGEPKGNGADVASSHPAGRWPPNVILDPEAAAMLDEQTGETGGGFGRRGSEANAGAKQGLFGIRATGEIVGYGDTGGASRFFYVPKADREERNRGLEHMAAPRVGHIDQLGPGSPGHTYRPTTQNTHPTVKPVALMQWLCRLITPPGGTVLDPFTGSGSTGIAALREGFHFIGIEREAEYVEIARDRIIGDAPLFNVEARIESEEQR